MPKPAAPRFLGVATIFGVQSEFSCSPLTNAPLGIDLFLGNPTGTTPGAPVRAYAISGTFAGPTSADVRRQIDALSALAGLASTLGYPTGKRFPDDFYWAPHYCYFLPAEYAPGAVAAVPGNQYAAPYKVVFRVID